MRTTSGDRTLFHERTNEDLVPARIVCEIKCAHAKAGLGPRERVDFRLGLRNRGLSSRGDWTCELKDQRADRSRDRTATVSSSSFTDAQIFKLLDRRPTRPL